MIVWKDETAYGVAGKQGEPRVYVAIVGGFRLSVHRNIFHEGVWMFSCYDIQIENQPLESPEISAAQTQALQLFAEAARDKAEELTDAAQFASSLGV